MKLSLKLTLCIFAATIGLALYSLPGFAATLLRVGSSGQEVSQLQQTLQHRGYYTHRITSYYGPITQDAVRRFQRANGLSTDGIAGPQTLSRLYANTVLRVGNSGQQVRQLQQTLANRGYFNHRVTGYYGSITRDAVIRFQRDNRLVVDGIAGPQTLRSLYNIGNTSASHRSEDIYWLSRIIEAEAGGESYNGKVAVGNVVLNRVNSSEFPSSVKDVIFQYYRGIPMFSPVHNGTIYNTPSQSSIDAAHAALNGARPVGNATYFYNPSIAASTWISDNKTYVTRIGGHVFYV